MTENQFWKTKIEYKTNPLAFSRDVLGSALWHKQVEILESVRDNARTTVRSGHSCGKTRIAAEVVLWWLLSQGPRCKVISTAPTFVQVEKILWSEIRSLYSRIKYDIGATMLNTELKIDSDWFGMGLSTNESDRFQGFKSPNLLVVLDEASGVDAKIWEAVEGLIPKRILAIGNPTDPVGNFAQTFKSDLWNKIKISSWDTPNCVQKKVVIAGLATAEWCDERKLEWGEDSPLYQSRVLGDFPTISEDTLIPLKLIEDAIEKDIHLTKPLVLACDVARMGTDSTAIVLYNGFTVIEHKTINQKEGSHVSGEIINILNKYQAEDIQIVIDDTGGYGGSPIDFLREQGYKVTGINFGSKARNSDKYENVRAEMYFSLREKFQKGLISIPNNTRLVNELATIKYEFTSRGKLKIVSKEQMKSMGIKSPDIADALAMANYCVTDDMEERRHRRIKQIWERKDLKWV